MLVTDLYIYMIRSLLIFVCCVLYINNIKAQMINIQSVTLQPLDKTAIMQPCLDNNGDTCALLKIKTDNLEGIVFSNPNQYMNVRYEDGIYYVYIPSISRKLDFQHKDYIPFQLDLADYGFRRLKNGKTYLVLLEVSKKSEINSSIVLKVEPSSAQVTFDDENLKLSNTGIYEIPVSAGKHSYLIRSENHQMQNNSVSIERSEVKTIYVKLLPINHEVYIKCNVRKARVFVDNIDYGFAGKLYVPQGQHIIRVQADGYVDSEKDILITSSTRSLSFILEQNKKTTHIHAIPVTIYSNSSCIYKNNKKIKNWYDGAKIMFMPGTYELSDNDFSSSLIIEVKDTPLYVNLKKGEIYKLNEENGMTVQKPVQEIATTPSSSSIPSQTFTVKGISFKMIRVEGGTFTMGAMAELRSDAYDDEKPAHQVTLSSYYIGETEVTQALWQAVMGSNPSFFKHDNHPVEQVSWDECKSFISKLNSLTGKNYRLPSEAEWEYSARGGNKSQGNKYSGSNTLGNVAWYEDNSGRKTHSVKTKSPNELGIYDMSGNVREWCQDWFGSYSSASQTNPTGATLGSYRVYRGGSWGTFARACRVSDRNYDMPEHRSSNLGLRLALDSN